MEAAQSGGVLRKIFIALLLLILGIEAVLLKKERAPLEMTAYIAAENLLAKYGPSALLDRVDQTLGYCRQVKSANNPLLPGQKTPPEVIPGSSFSYAISQNFAHAGFACISPLNSTPVLFAANEDSPLEATVYRKNNYPTVVALKKGDVKISAEKAHFLLRTTNIDLLVESSQFFRLQWMATQGEPRLILQEGQIHLTHIYNNPKNSLAQPVRVEATRASLVYFANGERINDDSRILLPGGISK